MDIFAQIAEKIIKGQQDIIGPVAIEQAEKVEGLTVDWTTHKIVFSGDKKDIVEKLVEQYRELFGRASVEVCREAVRGIISQIPNDQVPFLLK